VADKKRSAARALAEATAAPVPGGSFVTNILQAALPSKSEKGREEWQGTISERTNEKTGRLNQHERLLNPTTTLTGTNAQLAT